MDKESEIEVLFIKFYNYASGRLRKVEERFPGTYEDAVIQAEKVMKKMGHKGYNIVNQFGETVKHHKHPEHTGNPDYA